MLKYISGPTSGGLERRSDPADGRGEKVSCGATPEETARQGRRCMLRRDDAGRTIGCGSWRLNYRGAPPIG